MKMLDRLGALAVLVLLAAAGNWWWKSQPAEPREVALPVPQAVEEVAPPPAELPLIVDSVRYPVENVHAPGVEVMSPAPALVDGDALSVEALARLFGGDASFGGLLVLQDFVRRVVVTVDNLPGERLPLARAPLQMADSVADGASGGGLKVAGDGAVRFLDPDNELRYAAYVRLAERVSSAGLVAAYVRLYPLFQSAYDELGYPSAYFNDRLVAVIDHLLEAPEVVGPVRVLQPKVRYVFESPALERLSAGQKLMVRMGVDNSRRVKAKLRDLRGRLAGETALR